MVSGFHIKIYSSVEKLFHNENYYVPSFVVELNLDWASLIVLSNLPPTKLYIYLEDLKEKLIYLKQQSRLL